MGEALGDLPSRLGRSPTPRDVAAAVNAPVEDVLEAMEAATAYEAVSLDAPRPGAAETRAGRSPSRCPRKSRGTSSSRSARRCAERWRHCLRASG